MVIVDLTLQQKVEGSFGVDWIIFLLFVAYTMIPLPLRVTTLVSVIISLAGVVIVAATTAGINDNYSAGLIVREVNLI